MIRQSSRRPPCNVGPRGSICLCRRSGRQPPIAKSHHRVRGHHRSVVRQRQSNRASMSWSWRPLRLTDGAKSLSSPPEAETPTAFTVGGAGHAAATVGRVADREGVSALPSDPPGTLSPDPCHQRARPLKLYHWVCVRDGRRDSQGPGRPPLTDQSMVSKGRRPWWKAMKHASCRGPAESPALPLSLSAPFIARRLRRGLAGSGYFGCREPCVSLAAGIGVAEVDFSDSPGGDPVARRSPRRSRR